MLIVALHLYSDKIEYDFGCQKFLNVKSEVWVLYLLILFCFLKLYIFCTGELFLVSFAIPIILIF